MGLSFMIFNVDCRESHMRSQYASLHHNLALLGRHWVEAQSLNPRRSLWGPSISRSWGAHEASSTEETSERLAGRSSAGDTGTIEMLSGKAPEN